MDVVKVEHLSKSFGDLRVLSDISFSVHQGEVFAIIGPSGSGKSTLLRAITHLETASSGTIVIGGTRILDGGVYADGPTLRSALLKLGLVFQDFNLFPHFSVLRNITEAEKMTMVVVTHEMGFARDVADRAMLIDAGVIVEEGNARELIDNPRNERTRAFLKRFSQTSNT